MTLGAGREEVPQAVPAPMANRLYGRSSFPQKNSELMKGLPPGRLGGIQCIHDNFALVQRLPKLEQSHLNTTVP